MGKFGGRTTIDYFVDLADGEKINLHRRSELEFIMKPNDTLMIYKTPLLQRNKLIQYKSAHINLINLIEKTSLFQSPLILSLLIISGSVSALYLFFSNRKVIDELLGTAILVNAVIVLMYFLRY